ncbi:amidohydrolase family protein [Flocculibacter collagenilyticus]|uniref:amidohydrolase family protein n=1 Tax=Flocculibacter collagenilyticus TaxID=2744479 RepID=UPI0018F59708|nr:amidohydrolase family protein [Flocculibacter collagenilyticus]
MQIVDPHLHLINVKQGKYDWLQLNNPPHWPLKSHIPHNADEAAITLSAPFELKGFVHIEAGFDNNEPWREIDWLEQHCKLPFKSIAYADLSSISSIQTIKRLCNYQSVVGIRHILDEDAVRLLSKTSFRTSLQFMAEQGLMFEAQLNLSDQKAVALLAKVIKETAGLKVTINHAGFPFHGATDCWQAGIETLAQFSRVAIKCSGLEMMEQPYTIHGLQRILLSLMAYFSENRVMLASNFPVLTMAMGYQNFWHLCAELEFDEFILNKLMFTNAQQWYDIDFAAVPEAKLETHGYA